MGEIIECTICGAGIGVESDKKRIDWFKKQHKKCK